MSEERIAAAEKEVRTIRIVLIGYLIPFDSVLQFRNRLDEYFLSCNCSTQTETENYCRIACVEWMGIVAPRIAINVM